jgi:hypothetical protein
VFNYFFNSAKLEFDAAENVKINIQIIAPVRETNDKTPISQLMHFPLSPL